MLYEGIIFFSIFFSAILQLAVFPNVFFWNLGPNIMLLLVIFWTTQIGFERAFIRNILAGFILDLATFSIIGMNVASFIFLTFFISFISKRFLVAERNWRVFIFFITLIFATLINNFF